MCITIQKRIFYTSIIVRTFYGTEKVKIIGCERSEKWHQSEGQLEEYGAFTRFPESPKSPLSAIVTVIVKLTGEVPLYARKGFKCCSCRKQSFLEAHFTFF